MKTLQILLLLLLVVPSLSNAEDAALSGKLEYDGTYIETDSGQVVKLRPLAASISTARTAWYSFSSQDQSCVFNNSGRWIEGKSFFITRGGWWSDIKASAEILKVGKIKSIYVKGSDTSVQFVSFIFLYDEFVGDFGGNFFVPTNIPSMEAFGGRIECDLIPLGYTDGGVDAAIISANWGLWPDQGILRATIDPITARYDFADGAVPATFNRPAFDLAPNLLNVANGVTKIGETANVAFPACSDGCRVVGLLIQTNSGTFAVLGDESPY